MGDLYKLRCLDLVEKGNDIWFPNLYFNALIKIDKISGKIQIIDKFPNYRLEEQWLYTAVCIVDNKLVFVPHGSREIVSYDMIANQFTTVALNLDVVGTTWGYFLCAYAYKKFIYMFPAYTRCIVRFDTENNSIAYFDLGLNAVLRSLPKTAVCFIKEYEVIGCKIYIPFAMINAIAVFDLEKEQLEIKYLNIVGGCSTIKYAEGSFYLASCKDNRIYCWNEKTEKIMVYDEFPKEFVSGKYMFSCSYAVGNKIVFMPLESNMIISLNLRTKKICCDGQITNKNKESWKTYFVKRKEDKTILMTADDMTPCLAEYKNDNLEFVPYYICNDLFNREKIREFFLENIHFSIVQERMMDLEEYIEILKKIDNLIHNNKIKKLGKIIFEQIQKDMNR